MGRKRRKRIICPNCDTSLKEHMNFCPECGQENHIKRVSLKVVFEDFFKTYFTYDSKLLVTLKNLITKPSFLSNAYLQGKMVSYLPPIRLYIFISFIFFLIFNLTSSGLFSNFNIDDNGIEFEGLKGNKKEKDESGVSYTEIAKSIQGLANEKAKVDKEKSNNDDSELMIDSTDEIVNKTLKRFSKTHEIKAFVGFMKSKLPIVFFTLIPVLAFLYFIFFYKKELFYVDNLVFVLHIQSFLFLTLTIEALLCWIIGLDSLFIFPLFILIYIIIATKRFFNKKWWGTFWRLGIMSFIYMLLTILLFTGYFIIALRFF